MALGLQRRTPAVPPVDGRLVMITGAAGALGSATARALARHGARLALVDLNELAVSELAKELRGHGVEAEPFACNLLVDDELEGLVSRIEEDMGPVDVLISSAGMEINAALQTITTAEIDLQIGLHLRSPMLLTRQLVDGMRQRGQGHIVIISSMSGKVPQPVKSPYAAAKAGSIAFAHSIRRELTGTGVAVSVVAPGVVGGAGQAARALAGTSVEPPRSLGLISVDHCVDALLDVLVTRRGELDVTGGSSFSRSITVALQAAMPAWADVLLERSGVGDFWAAVAREHGRA